MTPVHIIIQLYPAHPTSLNTNTLKSMRLEPIKSATLLPPINIASFDLATFLSIKTSDVRESDVRD